MKVRGMLVQEAEKRSVRERGSQAVSTAAARQRRSNGKEPHRSAARYDNICHANHQRQGHVVGLRWPATLCPPSDSLLACDDFSLPDTFPYHHRPHAILSFPSLFPSSMRKLLTLTGDLNVVTEVTSLAIDLDAVVEVLLESGGVKDTVVGGAREVNEELVGGLALLGRSLGGLGNSLRCESLQRANESAILIPCHCWSSPRHQFTSHQLHCSHCRQRYRSGNPPGQSDPSPRPASR